jgi:hypothetical protein
MCENRLGTLWETLSEDDVTPVRTCEKTGNTFNKYGEVINGVDQEFYYVDCIKYLRATACRRLVSSKDVPPPKDEEDAARRESLRQAGTDMHARIEVFMRPMQERGVDVQKLLTATLLDGGDDGIKGAASFLQLLGGVEGHVKVHSVEKQLRSEYWMYAGTPDIVLQKTARGRQFIIADWKRIPGWKLDKYAETLFDYEQQLNMYKLLLAECEGIFAARLCVCSIHPDNRTQDTPSVLRTFWYNAADVSMPIPVQTVLKATREYMVRVRADDAARRSLRRSLCQVPAQVSVQVAVQESGEKRARAE